MTREEAISEWTFRSNHIKKWLDEYGEEPSIRHYVELIDMAIEALRHDVIFEQIKWERDTALQTLEEHSIGLGQKAEEGDAE